MMLLNFLALYIIMGIGADDVFVFTDIWAHSEAESADQSERLVWTYETQPNIYMISVN